MLSCLPAAQADIKLKTCGHMWRKSAFGFTQWADHEDELGYRGGLFGPVEQVVQ